MKTSFLCLLLATASIVVRGKIQRQPTPQSRNKDPAPLCFLQTWRDRMAYWAKINPEQSRASCLANVSKLYDPKPKGSCRLAVVDVGMPRSGSTLLMHLIEDALDLTFKDEWQSLNYFQAALHYLQSLDHWKSDWCTQFLLKFESDQNRLTNVDKSIILLKSHEFTEEVYNLCEHTLIVGLTRDVGDIISSKLSLGWVPSPTAVQLTAYEDGEAQYYAELLRFDISTYNCWKKYSSHFLPIKYSDMADYGGTTFKIASHIARYFPQHIVEYSDRIKEEINMKWKNKEGNPTIPSTMTIKEPVIKEADLEYIRQYWDQFGQ